MSLTRRTAGLLKKVIYGDTLLPGEFTVGLRQPQSEVQVTLEGLSTPLDVTFRHLMACCAPFLIGIYLERVISETAQQKGRLFLRFYERSAPKRLLGEIYLVPIKSISLGEAEVMLFRTLDSRNRCLPLLRLWA